MIYWFALVYTFSDTKAATEVTVDGFRQPFNFHNVLPAYKHSSNSITFHYSFHITACKWVTIQELVLSFVFPGSNVTTVLECVPIQGEY